MTLRHAANRYGPPYETNIAVHRDLLNTPSVRIHENSYVAERNLLFLHSTLQRLAEFGSLVLRNKFWKVILRDELLRALPHQRREPAKHPHAEDGRCQLWALRIQARLVIRFCTELWAQTLKSKCNEAQRAEAPPQCRDQWAARACEVEGSAGPDQEGGSVSQPEYEGDGG